MLSAQRYYILENTPLSVEEITSLTDTPESNESEKSWDDEVMITAHQQPQRYLITLQPLPVHQATPLPLISLAMHFPPPNGE